METINGECLCGNVQYQVPAQPTTQVLCHCTDCQTISGSAFYTANVVPLESVKLTLGEPVAYSVTADSGRINTRKFCPTCGTRVWAELPKLGMASVNGRTLKDADHFQPQATHMPASAPSWCRLDEALFTPS